MITIWVCLQIFFCLGLQDHIIVIVIIFGMKLLYNSYGYGISYYMLQFGPGPHSMLLELRVTQRVRRPSTIRRHHMARAANVETKPWKICFFRFCCALGPSLVTPTSLIEDTQQQILWWKCDVGTPWARRDSWENDCMSRVGESMACLAWGMSRRRCARNLFFSNSISISIFFYFLSIHFIPLQSTALHCAPTALVSPLCLLH